MSLKHAGVFFGAYFLGRYLSGFVIREPGSSRGFVERTDGFGLDEVAEAATVYVTYWAVKKMLGKVA